MNWYKGEIAEAITTSKTNGAIFVVYIEGKDEMSKKITKMIDSEEVTGKLEGDNFVAVKIEADSLPHQQFSQIYKQTPVPSLYFIGKQGTPLEIITEANDIHSLSVKLDTICKNNGLSIKQAQNTSTSGQNSTVVCENDVCTIRPSSSNVEDKKDLNLEDKVDRAKELLEKKRIEKQKAEEENERQKEIERRKVGQNVQQLKKWQEDQDLKHLLEEREKERRETQAARERVLAQIAQDKAERASRFSQPSTSATQPQPSVRTVSNSNTARLQFRLPDGKITTHDFSSFDTLQIVHSFIAGNLNLSFSTYTLSTTFPRREFTDEDRTKTLLELQLVPNAVILILPVSRGVVSTNSDSTGGFNGFLWNFFAPIFSLFGLIKNFLFGAPANSSDSSTSANDKNRKREAEPVVDERFRVKKKMGESTVVRRQGNVHGLSNRNDSDDDENNTWNGNSTQQM